MKTYSLLLVFIFIPLLSEGRMQTSNPELIKEDITIEAVADLPDDPVRIEFNRTDSTLYVLSQDGKIFRVNEDSGQLIEILNSGDHGLGDTQGFEISQEGTFFLVGNNRDGTTATNVAVIKRGIIVNGNRSWETVAETEPYPLSNTAFDHIMNGIVLSPDGGTLYINSGSRTDHGEVHNVDGKYPGLREAPLTAKILQLPSDATGLLLKNDLDSLKAGGYVYAEGTRNSFSLAFDANGNLFGTENAGDRDDPEELNWLREGHHYGFPWLIGGNLTPMQFEGYDPSGDPFIPPNSNASNLGTFYNDPDYPAQPEGIEFTSGVINVGPDADTFRDSADGLIKDASDLGLTLPTFSSHLSPLGLVFDTENNLGGEYTGDGFLLSFSGGSPGDAFLLNRMNYHGEDLIHMEFTQTGDNFEISATSVVKGFLNPIDAELVGNSIYVLEFKTSWLNSSNTTRLYKVGFPTPTSTEGIAEVPSGITLDQNYPNPFNPATRISFELNQPGFAELVIRDILGRDISSLIASQLPARKHTFIFDAAELPSGIYFYSLIVNGKHIETKKMLLAK